MSAPAECPSSATRFGSPPWLAVDRRTHRVIVLSAIDNLIKGAAGQAIQNLNIMFGLDEEAGLDIVPVSP